MKLRVMRKMNQWRYVTQPLRHPPIIKHLLSSKEKIKEAKTLSLCRDRSDRWHPPVRPVPAKAQQLA
jgi:hypothetical protein